MSEVSVRFVVSLIVHIVQFGRIYRCCINAMLFYLKLGSTRFGFSVSSFS